MNLETKITIYKFTPQVFTLTQKELGSGYKTATKLLAGTKILLSFHFLSSLVTFHFNTLRISGLPVTTRRIDSDDQYFVVTRQKQTLC